MQGAQQWPVYFRPGPKPCVRGLRYPVETLLSLLAAGESFEDILADYADLEQSDLLAVLAYAAARKG